MQRSATVGVGRSSLKEVDAMPVSQQPGRPRAISTGTRDDVRDRGMGSLAADDEEMKVMEMKRLNQAESEGEESEGDVVEDDPTSDDRPFWADEVYYLIVCRRVGIEKHIHPTQYIIMRRYIR